MITNSVIFNIADFTNTPVRKGSKLQLTPISASFPLTSSDYVIMGDRITKTVDNVTGSVIFTNVYPMTYLVDFNGSYHKTSWFIQVPTSSADYNAKDLSILQGTSSFLALPTQSLVSTINEQTVNCYVADCTNTRLDEINLSFTPVSRSVSIHGDNVITTDRITKKLQDGYVSYAGIISGLYEVKINNGDAFTVFVPDDGGTYKLKDLMCVAAAGTGSYTIANAISSSYAISASYPPLVTTVNGLTGGTIYGSVAITDTNSSYLEISPSQDSIEINTDATTVTINTPNPIFATVTNAVSASYAPGSSTITSVPSSSWASASISSVTASVLFNRDVNTARSSTLDINQKLDVAPISSFLITQSLSGDFAEGGYYYEFNIYPYRTINGTRYYSPTAFTATFTDKNEGSLNTYNIPCSWSYSAGAEGYAISIVQNTRNFAAQGMMFLVPDGNITSKLYDATVELTELIGYDADIFNLQLPVVYGDNCYLSASTMHVTASNALNASTASRLISYNTYTDPSNYERLNIGFSNNTASIALENAGTGVKRSLNISNDGTSSLFISSSGNVGINTIPTAKLHVSGSKTNETLLNVQNNTGTSSLFISSSGNVGIGTNTPTAILDIPNHSLTSNNIQMGTFGIQSTSTNNGFLQDNSYWNNSDSKQYYRSNGYSVIQQFLNGNLYFRTAPSGVAGAEAAMTTRLYIANTGNVGIGTTTPTSPLTVAGNVSCTGYFGGQFRGAWFANAGTSAGISPSSPVAISNVLRLVGLAGNNTFALLQFGSGSTWPAIKVEASGSGTPALSIRNSTDTDYADLVINALTGSVYGTSSYAISASYAPGSPSVSASYAEFAVSASYAPSSPSISASYALNADTASRLISYNLNTDAANFERLNVGFSNNTASIFVEKSGSGVDRPISIGDSLKSSSIDFDAVGKTLKLNTNGTARISMTSTGIAMSGDVTAPSNTISANILRGFFYVTNNYAGIGVSEPSAVNKMKIGGFNNNANFKQIQFGSGSTQWPSLCVEQSASNSPALSIRNGTDTAYADLVVNALTGSVSASNGWTGTYLTGDARTVTVQAGIITNVI